ncbi:MAG: lipid-A-disaccharide synthase [Aestuariibacter sp.]
MTDKPLRIGIVAGETSGDILAAGLIRAFKQQFPNAIFEGIAGPRMQALGCETLFDMEELSVMGLAEVLGRIRRLLHIRKTVLQYFIENPPDVFIGVDAPDFNLTLEMKLKERGIKTIHYVSPTVWAWRESRIHKIARATNMVFCIFPFEPAVYEKYAIPSKFVGHTMADQVPIDVDRSAAREQLNLNATGKILALLPGSRAGEVNTLLPTFIESAERLSRQVADLEVLIPVVNKERKAQVEDYLQQNPTQLNVRTVFGHAQEVMIASDAVLLASGTATLEAMLCKRPMVVAYRLKAFTYQMMKFLYKQKYFALPNILAGKELVPELLQKDVDPTKIAQLLQKQMLSEDPELQLEYRKIHHSLRQNADQQAARAVATMLGYNGA